MAEEKRDYYEVLGVQKNATDDDLKKAYRKIAKENHPDLHPGDKECEARFKEANEAYAVLSDSDKRSKYDQFGHAAFDPSMGGTGFNGDFGDIFGDIFGSIFGGGGGGRRQRDPNAPQKGSTIQMSAQVTFEEAAFGCEKELTVRRVEDCPDCKGTGCAEGTTPEVCPKCGGSGYTVTQQRTAFGVMQSQTACGSCRGTGRIIHQPCQTCHGAGSITKNRKATANIPSGIDDGQTICLRGLGNTGKNGGPSGDLLVTVSIRPHAYFRRQGNSVLYELPVSFVQAALGDEAEVPTLDGKVKYTIPEGTQSGTVFRIKGKGIPNIRGGGRGDQFITVKVVTPEDLSEAQKNLLREFAKATGEKVPEADTKKKKHKLS